MPHLALKWLPRWQAFRLEMNRAMEINGIHRVIDRVFPFTEARDISRYLESGSHFGKVRIAVWNRRWLEKIE
jgi:NADPH:quinone reductase-like Zn-dependent oxidoreductase